LAEVALIPAQQNGIGRHGDARDAKVQSLQAWSDALQFGEMRVCF
jgi:hypothetical protein